MKTKTKTLKIINLIFFVLTIKFDHIDCGCPVSDNPSQMFQCLTINPQAFIDLISKGDYKSFCHMANGYMTCMTTYVRDCLGGKAATGILEELQDLNLKCCISGRTQECVVKNPSLLSKCFASDNLITMADGSTKQIIESNIGDRVKAIDKNGKIVDSEIIDIIHKDSNSSTLFKVFYDSNENKISLTSSHLIFVNNKGYIKASEVQIGDELRLYSNNQNEFENFKIKRIDYVVKEGYIAPLTNHGTLLVNGVHASCYAEINSHSIADFSMLPIKLWYRMSQYLNLMDKNNHDGLVNVNFYFKFLHSFTSSLFPFLLK